MTVSSRSHHSYLPTPNWAAATHRVEKYLRAHRVSHDEVAPLAAEIVAGARIAHRPDVSPVTAAIELASMVLATRRGSGRKTPVASPPIRLGHMAAKRPQDSSIPSLAPKWAGLVQRSLLKITSGLAFILTGIGATWAGNR